MTKELKQFGLFFLVTFLIFGKLFGFRDGSEIIQSVGIGLGAVLAGLGGFTVFYDWLEKQKSTDKRIQELKIKYPRKKLGDNFEIIQPNTQLGWIHLLDKESKTIHWVKDLSTLRKLGFSGEDAKTIQRTEFDRYEIGEEIG